MTAFGMLYLALRGLAEAGCPNVARWVEEFNRLRAVGYDMLAAHDKLPF